MTNMDNKSEKKARRRKMNETYASNLKFLMASNGMTQVELAGKMGISQPLLNSYVNAKAMPKVGMRTKIATYFGTSVDDMTTYDMQGRTQSARIAIRAEKLDETNRQLLEEMLDALEARQEKEKNERKAKM